jgi:hypothetical protein
MGGINARTPTLINILSTSKTSSPVLTVRGPSKRACPLNTVKLDIFSSKPESHDWSGPKRHLCGL